MPVILFYKITLLAAQSYMHGALADPEILLVVGADHERDQARTGVYQARMGRMGWNGAHVGNPGGCQVLYPCLGPDVYSSV